MANYNEIRSVVFETKYTKINVFNYIVFAKNAQTFVVDVYVSERYPIINTRAYILSISPASINTTSGYSVVLLNSVESVDCRRRESTSCLTQLWDRAPILRPMESELLT